jgi:hypothetical protein
MADSQSINMKTNLPQDLTTQQILPPVSGQITHLPDGRIAWHTSGVQRRDFILDVEFVTPWSTTEQHWNNCIYFRKNVRAFVDSDGRTGYGWFDEKSVWNMTLFKGDYQLNLREGESNHYRLVCCGCLGMFYINGDLVGDLSLSSQMENGMIHVGFSERRYTRDGWITEFKNLTIHEI